MTKLTPNEFKNKIFSVLGAAPDTIIDDGRVRRFADGQDGGVHPITGKARKKKRSGWYVFHGTHGAFGSWHDGETYTWHSADRPAPATPEEQAKAEQARIEKDILQNGLRAAAARKANMLVSAAEEKTDHPYLTKKQISAGLVADDDGDVVVVVPITCDGTNVINAQVIHADGTKRFLPGGRVKGCFAVIGDPDKAKRLVVCEGYATGRSINMATGEPVICTMTCGNLTPVAHRISELWPKAELLVCADNDRATSGNPGVRHGMEAAKEAKARFTVPVFKQQAGGTDFNDLAVAEGLDTVKTQIEQAWFAEPLTYSQDEVLAKLLSFDAAGYQSERRKWADYLGRKLSDLDSMIDARRMTAKPTEKPAAEEPWPDPVDGATLLAELRDAIKRHVVLEASEAIACALWIVHTYVYEAAKCLTPILNITSATKRCGKTTLLWLLAKLVKSAKPSAGISGPAIYRTIEMARPTLLIDEADNVVSKDKADLLAVLNAGISPDTAKVTRCCGDDLQPKDFDTYCAKVLAGIGARIDTLEDRSITITLRRKSRDAKVQRVRQYRPDDTRRRLLRWAADHGQAIADAYQDAKTRLPEALNDRQQDIWEFPFIIADHVGGDWPKVARDAAVLLCGRLDADASLPEMLLADLYRYHQEQQTTKASSKVLVDWLNGQEERPWKDLRHGSGIDQRRLGSMLAGFGISSKLIRTGTDVSRGYDFDQFTEAFGAYINPSTLGVTEGYTVTAPESTGPNSVTDKNGDPLQSVTEVLHENADKSRACNAVTPSNGKTGEFVQGYV